MSTSHISPIPVLSRHFSGVVCGTCALFAKQRAAWASESVSSTAEAGSWWGSAVTQPVLRFSGRGTRPAHRILLCVPTPRHIHPGTCAHTWRQGGAPSGLCQLEVGFCRAPLIWTQDPGLLSPRLRPSFWKFCQTFHFIRRHLWLHVEWRTPASGFTPAPTSSICGSLIGSHACG